MNTRIGETLYFALCFLPDGAGVNIYSYPATRPDWVFPPRCGSGSLPGRGSCHW